MQLCLSPLLGYKLYFVAVALVTLDMVTQNIYDGWMEGAKKYKHTCKKAGNNLVLSYPSLTDGNTISCMIYLVGKKELLVDV